MPSPSHVAIVPLPPSTFRIPGPSRPDTQDHDWPYLKMKATPHVSLPSSLSPSKPNGKGIEDSIKVIVPIGSKVSVTWKVDTENIPSLADAEPHLLFPQVQGAVGEWLAINQQALGIDHFDYPDEPDPTIAELILTPIAALPYQQQYLDPLILRGEPVAELQKLEMCMSWAYPSKRFKQTSSTLNDVSVDPTHANADGGNPSNISAASQDVSDSGTPEPPRTLGDVLTQVGTAMKKMMRMQMVRRFPYVFDGDFLKYQTTLAMPDAIFDATHRFITLSARHNTPLLGQCRALLDSIDQAQTKTFEGRVTAVARLPARMSWKRPKLDSQASGNQATPRDQSDDDEAAVKIATYLERHRKQEAREPAETALRNSLARGVAAIGASKWTEARAGMGKLAAWRAQVAEADYYHELEPQAFQEVTPDFWNPELNHEFHNVHPYDPCPPLSPHSPLPAAPHDVCRELVDSDDEYDDLAEDDDADYGVDLPPDFYGGLIPENAPTHTDPSNKSINTLLLDLGAMHLSLTGEFDATFDDFEGHSLPVPRTSHSPPPPPSSCGSDLSDNDLDGCIGHALCAFPSLYTLVPVQLEDSDNDLDGVGDHRPSPSSQESSEVFEYDEDWSATDNLYDNDLDGGPQDEARPGGSSFAHDTIPGSRAPALSETSKPDACAAFDFDLENDLDLDTSALEAVYMTQKVLEQEYSEPDNDLDDDDVYADDFFSPFPRLYGSA